MNNTGNNAQKYQIVLTTNTAAASAEDIATEIADRIVTDGPAFVSNGTTDNGETWNIDVTAVGDRLEIRDKNGVNLEGTFTERDGFGWVGTNVPEDTSPPPILSANQEFATGSLVIFSEVFYGCKIGYNSDDNNDTPDNNTVNWTILG